MRTVVTSLILAGGLITGCASIPPEAPELSTQLGLRLSALESANVRLLEVYFAEKRRVVDQFIQEKWVPIFAEEFFGDPKIDAVWKQVVQSQNANDRLKFIVMVGPRLQQKINSKRIELIQPLDELERTIKSKIQSEYDQARAINNSLTSFLQSAAKVEQNRKRYLDMIGVSEKSTDRFINDTDKVVSELVDASGNVKERVADSERYREKMSNIIENLRR